MSEAKAPVPPSKGRVFTAVLLVLSLSGCDWDFDRDDFCDLAKPVYRSPSWIVPHSINCQGYSGRFSLTSTVVSDPDVSANFIGLGNFNLSVFVNPNSQVQAFSPAMPFAVLTGTASPITGGLHLDLIGTNQAAGFVSKDTLSLDMKQTAGGVSTISGTGNIDPSVDPHGVDYSFLGKQIASLSPSPCYSPGLFRDPGSLQSGEFIDQPEPDLSLGGILPVAVRRVYGSMLKLNGVTSILGDNWMTNFDVRLFLNGNAATVLFLGGATIDFVKSGSSWSPEDPQPLPYQLGQLGANYQFYDPDQNMIYTFSGAGALIRVEDRNGNALTVAQGPDGPTQISDGLGRTLTFTYNTQNKLASISDPSGRMVSYGYQGSNLTSFTDAAGKTATYGYTTAGGLPALLVSIKRPLMNTTVTNVYDGSGRVVRQTDGLNNSTTFSYSASAPGTTTETDALGNQTKTTHTDLLHHDSVADALGKVTTIAWDAANRPLSLLDRIGGKTTAAYDPNAGAASAATAADGSSLTQTFVTQTQGLFTFYLVSKQTFGDGTTLSYQYDSNGNLTSQTDARGVVVKYTLNARGQRITEQNSLGGTTTNTYATDGTLTSVQTPAGDVTQYAYDALNRLNKITFPDGSTRSFTYDALDRVIQTTAGSGDPSTVTFDDNGNVQSLSSGNTTFTYDANDRATSRTVNGATRSVVLGALGRARTLTNETGEQTNITYDALGRTQSVTDGAGAGYKLAWNAQGYLQSLTDPNAQTSTVTTDPVGRFLSITTPLGEKFTSTYDRAGRPLSNTSPLSHTAKFTYASGGISRVDLPLSISGMYARNADSQLIAITDPNGSVWTQSFDSQGRRTGFADPLGHATGITFDKRDRIASAANPLGNVQLVYSSQGSVTQQAYSDGTTLNYRYTGGQLTSADNLALGYDAGNRVTSSNGIVSTRDAAGRLLTIAYGRGKTLTYKYNSLGLLSAMQDWVTGTTTFTYDSAHNLLSIQRPNGTKTTFTRDANGRILSIAEAISGGAYSIALTLDAEGKVTAAARALPQAPQPARGISSHSYDAADQLANATYDAMGRLTSDSMRKYSWDLASRLLSYSGSDGSAQFTYDGLGLRVSSTSGGSTLNYVWNYAHDLPVLAVVRSGTADVTYNIFTPEGAWLYSIDAQTNARSFAHFDEEGSTSFLTNDSGTVTDSYGVTAFGESVTHSGTSTNPFTFHGAYGVMQEGNTGLYYMRARYYDSASGRFLSRDPVQSADPIQVNPYQFALNNPLGFADPRGTTSEPQFPSGRTTGMLGYDRSGNKIADRFLSGYGRERSPILSGIRPMGDMRSQFTVPVSLAPNPFIDVRPGNGLSAFPLYGPVWTGFPIGRKFATSKDQLTGITSDSALEIVRSEMQDR